MPEQNPKAPFKRKKKYVRPDLQARLILGSLGITLVVTFIGTHIPLVGLWQFTAANGGENNALIDHMSRFFTASFYVSILLTASLATWFGYWYSFRFCGPIYAIKKYFAEMPQGDWGREMRLRQKDDLQDVKDAINVGLGAMRTQLVSQRHTLEAAEKALTKAAMTDESCNAVLAAVRADLATCAERFPGPVAVPSATSNESTTDDSQSSEATEDTPSDSVVA